MVINVYNREEVPNPLDTSEFELQSNLNERKCPQDVEYEYNLRNKKYLMDLKMLTTQDDEIKPKIINDTGSLKTTTMQCPYCERIFNALTAKAHIPICQKTKNRPKPPPVKEEII